MEMTKVELLVPKEMVPFVATKDSNIKLKQNALLLYPYIERDIISYGKAAELLEVNKLDLLDLYGRMGLVYFDMDVEEINEEIDTIKSLRG